MTNIKRDSKKIAEGTLERIVEVGQNFRLNWSSVPRGGDGVPTRQFVGNYTRLIISKGEETEELTVDSVVLPDSLGHIVQAYQVKESVTSGSGPFKKQDRVIATTTELYDSKLDRWYKTQSE